MNSMKELLVEELKDLYDAEQQLVQALPKMRKQTTDTELREAIDEHILETQEQVVRLEKAFRALNEKPTQKTCHGMQGLIEEAEESSKQASNDSVRDMSIIAHALRIEHYEVAAYRIAITIAERIDEYDVVELLEESLSEEEMTAEMLEGFAGESFFEKMKQAFSGETSASA